MDEIEKFKNFLGPVAKEYNDAQLRQLRREMYAMAELLLDIYMSKRQRKRSPSRETTLTGSDQEATIPA